MRGARIRNILKKSSGFTMLEMIITVVLVSIFFTGVVTILPTLTKSYNKIISLNYARQVATSVSASISEQLTYADEVKVTPDVLIDYRYKGKPRQIVLGKNGVIPGLIYGQDGDKGYYMDKDVMLEAELETLATGDVIVIATIDIYMKDDDTKPIMTKEKVVRLYGAQ